MPGTKYCDQWCTNRSLCSACLARKYEDQELARTGESRRRGRPRTRPCKPGCVAGSCAVCRSIELERRKRADRKNRERS